MSIQDVQISYGLLSVVVPVFNEAENLEILCEKIFFALKNQKIEIIFVDDGSSDNSWEILKKLLAKHPEIRILKLARNFGQTSALAAGISVTCGEWIATLDADLQNDPQDIVPMLELMNEYDIVSGWRKKRLDDIARTLVSKIANQILAKITGLSLHDYGCSMKVYRASTLKSMNLYGEMHRFLPIYAWLHGAKVTEKEVRHQPRIHGKSKYGFARIFRVLVDMCMFYFLFHSLKPLGFFAKLAVFFLITTLTLFLIAIYHKAVLFWFLTSIFFSFSLFLILFGLILELIIRTHYLSQNESQYIILENASFNDLTKGGADRPKPPVHL